MSFELTKLAVDGLGQAKLSSTDRLVCIALTASVNSEDNEAKCWISNPALAHKTGVKESTVKKSISHLVKSGLITREKRAGTSSRTYFHVGKLKELARQADSKSSEAGELSGSTAASGQVAQSLAVGTAQEGVRSGTKGCQERHKGVSGAAQRGVRSGTVIEKEQTTDQISNQGAIVNSSQQSPDSLGSLGEAESVVATGSELMLVDKHNLGHLLDGARSSLVDGRDRGHRNKRARRDRLATGTDHDEKTLRSLSPP